MFKTLSLIVISCIASVALAGPNHEHKPVTNKEFDKLKTLVGKWEGKGKMGSDKEETINIHYELTSGGRVLVEKLNPGTEHEMISVYTPDGGKGVSMTHYCMLPNQPKLSLKKSDDKSIDLVVKGNAGLKSPNEEHMHALNITWDGKEKITQTWTSYAKGKKKGTSVFNLTRD